MAKILLVEDDIALSGALKSHMEKWRHEVLVPQDFQDVMAAFTAFSPELVILDIMLPFFNGFYWCERIRQVSHVPIVFLSSASDNMNIVMAVSMGGDDFIAKPVETQVLMAKLQAMLRRAYAMPGEKNVLRYGEVVLDLGTGNVLYGGETIELTRNEFRILELLMTHAGSVVSREALMTRLWQMDMYVEENTLTVNVNRLRKKLEAHGLCDLITTKIGSGYLLGTPSGK